ncbi:MAG: T9SS type A sorting domain-containing protein, partial [bacterium]
YFWMSYQATQNGILCWGYAYYAEDKINYTPSVLVRFHTTHPDRYALLYKVGIGDPQNPDYVKYFFDWIIDARAVLAYPASNTVLDLSDAVSLLNPYSNTNSLFIGVIDESPFNSYAGTLTYFSAEVNTWPQNAVSTDPPVAIPDYPSYVYADLNLAGTPRITIDLTPHNVPIQIPATGGSFTYDLDIDNVYGSSQTLDFWSLIIRPDSSLAVPLLLRTDITMPIGATISRANLQQYISEGSQAGDYTFVFCGGQYPDTVYASDSFPFVKLATDAGANLMASWFEDDEVASTPQDFAFAEPSPNPFNPTTTLTFTLPQAGAVKLEVFDVNGRMVGAKQSAACFAHYTAGTHQITFDGSNLPTGIYFARLQAGDYTAVRKLVLMK